MLITHDMGVVAETAQRVVRQVCRPAGRGSADRATCSRDPHHPYTAALLGRRCRSTPRAAAAVDSRRRAGPMVDRPAAACSAALPLCAPTLPAEVPPRRRAEPADARCHYPLLTARRRSRSRRRRGTLPERDGP